MHRNVIYYYRNILYSYILSLYLAMQWLRSQWSPMINGGWQSSNTLTSADNKARFIHVIIIRYMCCATFGPKTGTRNNVMMYRVFQKSCAICCIPPCAIGWSMSGHFKRSKPSVGQRDESKILREPFLYNRPIPLPGYISLYSLYPIISLHW